MVIKPKIRGFICTNAHPVGCAEHVQEQINYVKAQGPLSNAPKNVLVIGASTGYGLASRITAAFGGGAKTLGIFFEKEGSERKTGSAGWYNTAAFQAAAEEAGLWSKNINGDAFSNEIKQKAIDTIKADLGKIDLVIYSLASPRRTDPNTGETYSSTLKPIGSDITTKNLNTSKRVIDEVTVEAASQEDIDNTIKVMGGEDWEMWIDALKEADVLADNFKTTAYTYIGKELTWPIYGHATIGKAKEDLDRATQAIKESTKDLNGEAYVSSLNAVVTQASSAIPIMPLYISALFKVMKADGTYEGTIEQIHSLFTENLYGETPRFDEGGHLFQNYKELEDDVQARVQHVWDTVDTDTIDELTDYVGYHNEFLRLFGFGIDSVDYEQDVNPDVAISQLID
ncbi:trans-2-enoyl-CoA reductase family protein [Pseudoalteromonas shioyasakiensis]|uniref:enoyl-ACP reductase FabV n=2 Tax=Pseudoalteromonas TaxID=53246 RepID=UPI000C92D2C1|nr:MULTISPECIES: enoyl-ACP reductase FabV [Pseudoalteromonas]MAD03013.1 enoyl-[acyl-carrier-protein] reductase FabV [Pseudoalteromonas sp.]MCG9710095.1 trans-2-enoyl-CoA reductase family protein [Pseudoalteromonas sp. Isolate3]MCQ8883977.1 trans-2-enoyl-CoA reductase family protein [Pseudoalteromonas shioyasakiensis]NIZ07522.1 trans-2-enoyl-CoA reductase family protein [Pseudoalteromonas sp. HF66]RZD23583.1 trans-2-enoyl-CoA reductase family protein [Pseudoalteromonas sp. MEBiC 03485]|tara:strand:+ start:30301 stop:31494 length:1194 start_codon:yes stop_codon:yes gene_type:complete